MFMLGDPLPSESRSWAGRLPKLAEASSIVASTRALDTLPAVIAEQARAIVGANFCITHLNLDTAPNTLGVSSSDDYAAWRDHADGLILLGKTISRVIRLTQAEFELYPAWRSLSEQIG